MCFRPAPFFPSPAASRASPSFQPPSGPACSTPAPPPTLPSALRGMAWSRRPEHVTSYINALPWLPVALGRKPKLLPRGRGGALNGPSQTPPPTPPPCPRLRHTGLIWLPRAPSSLPPSLCTGDCFYLECSCHRLPTVMPSDSRHFHPQCLFLERGRDGFSPLAPFSLVYLPLSTFY